MIILATIAIYLYSAEISAYELAFLQASSISSEISLLDHKYTDCLTALLRVSQKCANHFLELDIASNTAPTQLVFSHSLKILHYLLTLQDVRWNSAMIVGSIDLSTLLECTAASAEQANAKLRELVNEETVFAIAAQSLRDMAPKWRKVRQDQEPTDSTHGADWTAGQEYDLHTDIFVNLSDGFWADQPLSF